jgi:hypothetical protein
MTGIIWFSTKDGDLKPEFFVLFHYEKNTGSY